MSTDSSRPTDTDSDAGGDSNQGTLPASEMAALLAAARATSYRAAIESLDLPVLKRKKSWFLDERRAAPYRALDLNGAERALDIGAGAGVISASLASRFSQVVALEYKPELSQFMQLRFAQDGVANVTVLRGDGLRLPFAAAAFDLVVVNGVLEWVADFAPTCDPRDVQLDFLRGIQRVLRHGGKAAIAIENRWYFRHFQGQSPHGEPPYVAVMPRAIANLVMRSLGRASYRTYIHSFWAYRRLLAEAGFKRVDISVLMPNYYLPKAVVSANAKAFRAYLEAHPQEQLGLSGRLRPGLSVKRLLQRSLVRLNVWPLFEHSYLIVGEK